MPRRPFSSVRIRTTALATVVVAFALLVGATAIVLLQRGSMIDSLDTSAQNRAKDLGALVRSGALPPTIAVGKQEDEFAQVVDARGQVVATSENIEGESPVARRSGSASSVHTVHVDALGEEFRVAARPIATPTGTVIVFAGESLEPVEAATGELVALLAGGIPLLLAVVAGMAWVVTGRALRPVEEIRAEVASISGQDLHRRVPEPATHDEISQLANTMNEMLDRLEDAYARQGRFVSDASHELQTPIAALRARFEVDLAHPDRADWLDTEREALEEITGLQRLVEDLLTLARLPNAAQELRRRPVDLDDVVLREAERIRTRGRVAVDLRAVSSGQIKGDASQLRRVVRNLLDNAERHATSAITLSVAELSKAVEVSVADDGPGIPPDDRQRIFERFTRLDDARTPHVAGTGLGLAIAREIVEAHGGTLSVEDSAQGAHFVIRFPAPITACP